MTIAKIMHALDNTLPHSLPCSLCYWCMTLYELGAMRHPYQLMIRTSTLRHSTVVTVTMDVDLSTGLSDCTRVLMNLL